MTSKAVFAFIRGGIGNQMFIYAAARSIAIPNQAKLVLITDSFQNETHGRNFLLGNFSIQADVTHTNMLDHRYSKSSHAIAAISNKFLHAVSLRHPHYMIERNKSLAGRPRPVDRRFLAPRVNDFVFLDGFFQHEKYFLSHADTIRSELVLKEPASQSSQTLARKMAIEDSICIHFRRTELEFNAMQEKHGKAKWLGGYREGLGMDYYQRAIDIINNKVSAPHYYCFSDYPDWVKDNIKLPANTTFVTHNNSPSTCHEDIYLMGQCKHHIISHSTFGWWGAWLGQHIDQIVIAPINVCGRPKPPYYPEHWIKLEVCLRRAN